MLVNPGKRKRYHVLEGELEEGNMSKDLNFYIIFIFLNYILN
jgi:hypothetical protein